MIALTVGVVAERWLDVEMAVDATPAIDPWCSGPDWILPASSAFAAEAPPLLIEEPGCGFALLARHRADDGSTIIAGLEPLWGFAAPIFGSAPALVAATVATRLAADADWERIVLPGLPDDGRLLNMLALPLSELGTLGVAEGITRQLIDLRDGPAAWLNQRRPSFRRNLRNAQRRASAASVTFTVLDSDPNVFQRILTIEQDSWKGRADDGITSPEMGCFYQQLIERLQSHKRLRAAVAQRDGNDIGYILGGIRGPRYRGLQLSYVQSAASLSVSHLLQAHEIHRLSEESVVTYDMGMDMDYKRRWADYTESSVTLVVDRS